MRTHHGTLAYLHNWPHQLAHCFGLEKGLCPWVPAAGEFPPGLAETQSTNHFPGLAASTKNSADKSKTLVWVENDREQQLLFNFRSPSAAPAEGCSAASSGRSGGNKRALFHQFLDSWLFKSQFTWIIHGTWERWLCQQKAIYSRKPNGDGVSLLGLEAIH